MKLQWQEYEGKLNLFISDVPGVWIHYRKHKNYVSDFGFSSNSGFRTAQNCLKLGYKYIPTEYVSN